MWLRSEEVEGVDIAVGGSSVGDLFDVWRKSGPAAHLLVHEYFEVQDVLVMFSFKTASSSTTLSSTRLLSRSTTNTFHYEARLVRPLDIS